jgi:hypothetical protein
MTEEQQQQQPQHYAFVSRSAPLELPTPNPSAAPVDSAVTTTKTAQETLLSLYQSYAERYPNPKLQEEYRERDQLLQATSAAHNAARSNKPKTKSSGGGSWLGFLFGGSSSQEQEDSVRLLSSQHRNDAEDEDWLEYFEEQQPDDDDIALLGTHYSLDVSCIPQEAHSMARLLLASARTRKERPFVIRTSPFFPSDSTLVIADLGVVGEFYNNQSGEEASAASAVWKLTSDYHDLQQYAAAQNQPYDLSLARAAMIGPNFVMISWGFMDGCTVFYRRIELPNNNNIAWEPVVYLGPSQQVLEHSFDLFAEEEDSEDIASALFRVTDICPLVVNTPEIPAASLAVSRLGGYVEILPLPHMLWYGPVLPRDRHKPRPSHNKRKRSASRSHHHYCKPFLVNVASDKAPIPIMALTTLEYQIDVLTLEAIRTRVTMDTEWDRELYGKAPPPAEYILVASGTQAGSEILTFWAISYLFAESSPSVDGSAGFTLHAVLQEALDVGPVGADLSFFCNRSILNQWRHPRKVALKERLSPPSHSADGEDEREAVSEQEQHQREGADEVGDDDASDTPKSVYDRVTTITTAAPIVAMQAVTVPTTNTDSMEYDMGGERRVLLSLLDYNGSVTLMDCSLLERMVSHSLSQEEYRAIHDTDMAAEQQQQEDAAATHPSPDPIALVRTLMDRSRMMQWMKTSITKGHKLYQCTNVQWLARTDNSMDPWLVFLLSNTSSLSANNNSNKDRDSRVMIMSGLWGEDILDTAIQTVPFPTSQATLQGTTMTGLILGPEEDHASSLLRIVFPPPKKKQKRSAHGRNFNDNKRLCFCLLQPLESHDVIASLARDGKYQHAIRAALQLSSEQQQHVAKIVQECRQKLWEQSADMKWLKQVTDDSYVVQQALLLFESSSTVPDDKHNSTSIADGTEQKHNQEEQEAASKNSHLDAVSMDTCRDICTLALQRLSKIRLASALSLGISTDKAKNKLQGMLVRLGTYELLCLSLQVEPSFATFRQLFARVNLVDLAMSFAPLADLASLSILGFRHSKELQSSKIDILAQLPVTLDPQRYSYLLPVMPVNSDFFMTASTGEKSSKLLHISQLPPYLKEKLDLRVVLNGKDEKMVLELNSGSSDGASCGEEGSDKNEDRLASFYLSRTDEMQPFIGNLQHISDLCALGLLAVGISVDADQAGVLEKTKAKGSEVHKLYCTWGCSGALQRMLSESVGDTPMEGDDEMMLDLSPFATVTPIDLWSMELVDVVKMVLGGQDDPETIFEICKQHLLPLLKFLPVDQTGNLDQAIKSYCIEVVRSSVYSPVSGVGEEAKEGDVVIIDDRDGSILKSMQICAAIAFGSRTTLPKSGRIIKDKRDLMNLMVSAVFEVSLRCEHAPLENAECRTIVKRMWDMYESLPATVSKEEESDDEDFIELMTKVDSVYLDLVALDILSQWPECHSEAFSFVVGMRRLREGADKFDDQDKCARVANGDDEENETYSQSISLGQKALATICRSFCSQAASQKGVLGLEGLLRDLISDIEQFLEICFGQMKSFQPALVDTISSELIAPLSRLAEFELVAQFLSAADKTWWDREQEAKAVQSYLNDIVFVSEKSYSGPHDSFRDKSLQAAMSCQDALGPVFPELQAGFQSTRGYLDAAHFINTVIFAELNMQRQIKPTDLRGDLPLDVVESILKALPKAIIIGCKEWGEAQLAVHANKALRDFQEKSSKSPDEVDSKNLPPLPGGAVFHLARILGLEDASSVLVVKSRVVHYGVASELYGASAAVCRTIMRDKDSFSSQADSLARLAAVAEVVTQDKFDDLATKRELCVAALEKYQGTLSISNCKPFDAIIKVYTTLEHQTTKAQHGESIPQSLALSPPSDSMGCLFKDTWAQYSINIFELFSTLQQNASSGLIDDSLLNALSRYVFFCCIFRSTRPRTDRLGELEKSTTDQLLVLGAALLLHIQANSSISIPAVKELRQILEKQALAVVNQHPTAFEEPLTPNEEIVRLLVGRGFTAMAARRSALAVKNTGAQQALQWGVANARDPRINDPIIFVSSNRKISVDKIPIQQIMNTFTFVGKFLAGTTTVEEFLRSRSHTTVAPAPVPRGLPTKAPAPVPAPLVAARAPAPAPVAKEPPSTALAPALVSKEPASGIRALVAPAPAPVAKEPPSQAPAPAPLPDHNRKEPALGVLAPVANESPSKAPALIPVGKKFVSEVSVPIAQPLAHAPAAKELPSKAPTPPAPLASPEPEAKEPPPKIPISARGPREIPSAVIPQKVPAPIPAAPPASKEPVPTPPAAKIPAHPVAPPIPSKERVQTLGLPEPVQAKPRGPSTQVLKEPQQDSNVYPPQAPPPVRAPLEKPKLQQTTKAAPPAQPQTHQAAASTQREAPQPSAAKPNLPSPNLNISTGPAPANVGVAFVTPKNRPPSLHLGGSTGGTTASDRSALRQKGESTLESMRSTPRSHDKNLEERRRLIEAGRRLLAKSRATPPSNTASKADFKPTNFKPAKQYQPIGPSPTARSSAGKPRISPAGTVAPLGVSPAARSSSSTQSPSSPAAKAGSPSPGKPTTPVAKVTKLSIENDDWGFDDETKKSSNAPKPFSPSGPPVPVPAPKAPPQPSPGSRWAGLVKSTVPAASISNLRAPLPAVTTDLTGRGRPAGPPAPAPSGPRPPQPAATASSASLEAPGPASSIFTPKPQPSATNLAPALRSTLPSPQEAVPAAGQGGAAKLEASDGQGDWDFNAEDLGDIEVAPVPAPLPTSKSLPPAATNPVVRKPPPVPVPPQVVNPATSLGGVSRLEASDSQGDWDFDADDLEGIDSAPVPAPLPSSSKPQPFVATKPVVPKPPPLPAQPKVANPNTSLGGVPKLEASDSQFDWDFDADDLGDIDTAPAPSTFSSTLRPQTAANLTTEVPPIPAPLAANIAAPLGGISKLEASDSQGDWDFDGEDDLRVDAAAETNLGADKGEPNVTKLSTDDGDGWDDFDF